MSRDYRPAAAQVDVKQSPVGAQSVGQKPGTIHANWVVERARPFLSVYFLVDLEATSYVKFDSSAGDVG